MSVAFITGATSGFGLATARLFARNGWRVVATGRRADRLAALSREFADGQILAAPMDLTDRASIASAVAGLPADLRTVDCLVNNGGLALGTAPVPEVEIEDWERMIDTNIKGLIYTTLEMLPLLRAAGRGASIVNIGSVAWRWAYPGGNVYGGTKAFVHQFTQNLRTDLAGSDIRVTAIEPGMAKTEFMLVRSHGDAGLNETYYEGVEPLNGDDIADLVWFVATRPPHVNIGILEVTPVAQVPGAAKIVRN